MVSWKASRFVPRSTVVARGFLAGVFASSRLSFGDYRLRPRLALLSLLIRLSGAGHLLQAAENFPLLRPLRRCNLPPGTRMPLTVSLVRLNANSISQRADVLDFVRCRDDSIKIYLEKVARNLAGSQSAKILFQLDRKSVV